MEGKDKSEKETKSGGGKGNLDVFPIYSGHWLSDSEIVCVGGGGNMKAGFDNCIQYLKVSFEKKKGGSGSIKTEEIRRFRTGEKLPYFSSLSKSKNGRRNSNLLLVCLDDEVNIFDLDLTAFKFLPKPIHKYPPAYIRYATACFSDDNQFIYIGGDDGYVRMYFCIESFNPNPKKEKGETRERQISVSLADTLHIESHNDQIKESRQQQPIEEVKVIAIDSHPLTNHTVIVCNDGTIRILNCDFSTSAVDENENKHKDKKMMKNKTVKLVEESVRRLPVDNFFFPNIQSTYLGDGPKALKYQFTSSKFSPCGNYLYTVHHIDICHGNKKLKHKSYLTKWKLNMIKKGDSQQQTASTYQEDILLVYSELSLKITPVQVVFVSDIKILSMAIQEDGFYIALGDGKGNLYFYTSILLPLDHTTLTTKNKEITISPIASSSEEQKTAKRLQVLYKKNMKMVKRLNGLHQLPIRAIDFQPYLLHSDDLIDYDPDKVKNRIQLLTKEIIETKSKIIYVLTVSYDKTCTFQTLDIAPAYASNDQKRKRNFAIIKELLRLAKYVFFWFLLSIFFYAVIKKGTYFSLPLDKLSHTQSQRQIREQLLREVPPPNLTILKPLHLENQDLEKTCNFVVTAVNEACNTINVSLTKGRHLLQPAFLQLILPLLWNETKENVLILCKHNWWRTLHEIVYIYDWKGTAKAFTDDGKTIYTTYLANDLAEIFSFLKQLYQIYIYPTRFYQNLSEFTDQTKITILENEFLIFVKETLQGKILPQVSTVSAQAQTFIHPYIKQAQDTAGQVWTLSEGYVYDKMVSGDFSCKDQEAAQREEPLHSQSTESNSNKEEL